MNKLLIVASRELELGKKIRGITFGKVRLKDLIFVISTIS